MRNNFLAIIALTFALGGISFSAHAANNPAPSEWVVAEIPKAELVGAGRMHFMMLKVYDAALYAPQGNWNPDKPFALTLHYLRTLEGEDIAKRSIEEMRGQGFRDEVKLAAWFEQMRAIFPNVTAGSELTGISIPNQETRFYSGGKLIGQVKDAEFGQHFFGIWLNEKTSEPKLRQKLLGTHAP